VNDIEVRAHRPRRKDGLMDASVDVGGANIFGFRCAR